MANNNKHTGPNVPALRFPEFSGEWEKMSLQDCCSDFSYGLNAPAKAYDGVNKYIRITDIDENTSVYKSDDPVSPDGLLSDEYLVNENDILFARTGASTGKTYLYNQNDGRLFYAGFLIKANVNNNCDPYFIFSQTKTQSYRRWVEIMSTRSGQPGINSQEYASYPLYVPSKEEQEKIALLLRDLDKRILVQSKIIEELKTLRSALLEKVFQVSNPTLEVGAIAHQTSERNKLCRYSNVLSVSNRFGFINQSEQFEDRNVASDDVRNYKVVHRGDFAYNPARINVGSIAMLKSFESGIVSPMYICFQVDDTIVDPSFFELFLETKAFKDEMEIRLEGSVRRCLSFEALCEIHLPRPALLVQRSISDKIGNISSKIKLEDRILRAYIRQKECLLKQMFI